MVKLELETLGYKPSALAIEENSSEAIAGPHHWQPQCKFLCWYQNSLCPVESLYFSDEKSTTVEK